MDYQLKSNLMSELNKRLNDKIEISVLPTPVQKLNFLSKELGANIYLKRDDMTGLAFGGSKTRKLDYLFKQAVDLGAETVVTVGALQSNTCRLVAAASKKLGLNCILILVGKDENPSNGNLLICKLLGVKLIFKDNYKDAIKEVEHLKNSPNSEKVYYIPMGASNLTGTLGYINAYKEILEDEKKLGLKFDYIYIAAASLGSQAGLIIGKSIFGGDCKIRGININKDLKAVTGLSEKEKIEEIINQFNLEFNTQIDLTSTEIENDGNFSESGYGNLNSEEAFTLRLFAEREGILLDPIYTARVATGMLHDIKAKTKKVPEGSNVLMIHTGGTPALFCDIFTPKMSI